jgi:hypothetical protein
MIRALNGMGEPRRAAPAMWQEDDDGHSRPLEGQTSFPRKDGVLQGIFRKSEG